ncbi:sporulation protein YqfD [Jeotgalibacillus soli]|uniref:Stage IV sporulation protein n=1 Tax=Jeotgalibacillus soli TaxID=889306 RepID=A0A0C2VKD7_9BACL|nr:sporulation protein YqfD [Jeotgalibacillus soli]KIL44448.1 hypothetical protein KP78_34120 [Jeotgalibacillus soli]
MKRILPGTVLVTVKGDAHAIVIRRLHEAGVPLRQIKVIQANKIEFLVTIQSLSAVRKAAYRSGCRIDLKQSGGLVFFAKKMFTIRSFLLWMLIAVGIVIVLSQFLWSIELAGATPEIQQEVKEALKEQGIRSGRLQRSLPKENDVASALYKHVDKLSWMGMEWKGTTLIIRLKEKQGMLFEENNQPSHIVAAKTGTIQSMLIEAGQPIEKVNSVVKKGQIIVSGLVGREEDQKAVASKGVVLAETWYEVNVAMPLTLTREELTGEETTRMYLHFQDWRSPPLHIKPVPYKRSIEEVTEHDFKLFGKELPFRRSNVHYLEVERKKESIDRKQAINIALKVARKEVLSLIGGIGHIQNEKILHEQIENGKVKLTIYFQTIEDIAEVKPFTEETRE